MSSDTSVIDVDSEPGEGGSPPVSMKMPTQVVRNGSGVIHYEPLYQVLGARTAGKYSHCDAVHKICDPFFHSMEIPPGKINDTCFTAQWAAQTSISITNDGEHFIVSPQNHLANPIMFASASFPLREYAAFKVPLGIPLYQYVQHGKLTQSTTPRKNPQSFVGLTVVRYGTTKTLDEFFPASGYGGNINVPPKTAGSKRVLSTGAPSDSLLAELYDKNLSLTTANAELQTEVEKLKRPVKPDRTAFLAQLEAGLASPSQKAVERTFKEEKASFEQEKAAFQAEKATFQKQQASLQEQKGIFLAEANKLEAKKSLFHTQEVRLEASKKEVFLSMKKVAETLKLKETLDTLKGKLEEKQTNLHDRETSVKPREEYVERREREQRDETQKLDVRYNELKARSELLERSPEAEVLKKFEKLNGFAMDYAELYVESHEALRAIVRMVSYEPTAQGCALDMNPKLSLMTSPYRTTTADGQIFERAQNPHEARATPDDTAMEIVRILESHPQIDRVVRQAHGYEN